MMRLIPILMLAGLIVSACWACPGNTRGGLLQGEQVTTTPLLHDGILYVASTETATHRGHLRAIDIRDTLPVTLWDAAERIPPAGADDVQATGIQADNPTRILFTNLARGSLMPLDAAHAGRLQKSLGTATPAEAETLLHAVRGRQGGSEDLPAGTSEAPERLWGISRSSPVLVDASSVQPEARQRDRVLYAGAEDGMLHAFHISRLDEETGLYRSDDIDGGRELWSYLPGSFLPWLAAQPLEDMTTAPVVHVDGTPVVGEFFVDFDGDGEYRWRTLLVASGTMLESRRSCLFVMDVTDPHQPQLLWERRLPGSAVGRTRGVRVGPCRDNPAACIYLTADFASPHEATGLHAMALSLETGQQFWQFSVPYGAAGAVAEATPAVPALLDSNGDDEFDLLVFGDLVGRLWALDLGSGAALGDAPVFTVPGGTDEPIGAGVAVHDRTVIFGTGGVAGAAENGAYALYAVKVTPEGGRLRWRYPLQRGEQAWATPVLDAAGNVVFATASGLLSQLETPPAATSGRLVALDTTGTETAVQETGTAVVSRVVAAPGVVIAVDLGGAVTQFGIANRLTGPAGDVGPARILSWRRL